MSAGKEALGGDRRGRLPWSGTRARTRELGYGDAMYEMFQMLAGMCRERPYLEPFLGPVRSHAYDCWVLSDPDLNSFDWHLDQAGMRSGTGDGSPAAGARDQAPGGAR